MLQLDVHEHQSFGTSSTGVSINVMIISLFMVLSAQQMGIITDFLTATAANSTIVNGTGSLYCFELRVTTQNNEKIKYPKAVYQKWEFPT